MNKKREIVFKGNYQSFKDVCNFINGSSSNESGIVYLADESCLFVEFHPTGVVSGDTIVEWQNGTFSVLLTSEIKKALNSQVEELGD